MHEKTFFAFDVNDDKCFDDDVNNDFVDNIFDDFLDDFFDDFHDELTSKVELEKRNDDFVAFVRSVINNNTTQRNFETIQANHEHEENFKYEKLSSISRW